MRWQMVTPMTEENGGWEGHSAELINGEEVYALRRPHWNASASLALVPYHAARNREQFCSLWVLERNCFCILICCEFLARHENK